MDDMYNFEITLSNMNSLFQRTEAAKEESEPVRGILRMASNLADAATGKISGRSSASANELENSGKAINSLGKSVNSSVDELSKAWQKILNGVDQVNRAFETLGENSGISKFLELMSNVKAIVTPVEKALSKFNGVVDSSVGKITGLLGSKKEDNAKSDGQDNSGCKCSSSSSGEKKSGGANPAVQLKDEVEKSKGAFETIQGIVNGMLGGLTNVFGLALKVLGPGAILGVVLAGLGLANQQFGEQISSMITMIATKGPEIINSLVTNITTALPALIASGAQILTSLMEAITANIEPIFNGAVAIISSLIEGVIAALPQLIPAALQMIETLAISLISAAPQLMIQGLNLLLAIVQGISENTGRIVETIANVLTAFLGAITEYLPTIFSKGVEILGTLITAIAKTVVQLIPVAASIIYQFLSTIGEKLADVVNKGGEIVGSLIQGLIDKLPQVIDSGVQLIQGFIQSIAEKIPAVGEKAMEIASNLLSKILEAGPNMIAAGKDLVRGFIEGIGSMIDSVVRKAGELASSAVDKVKEFLRIKSPSRVFKRIGEYTGQGFVLGMDSMISNVEKTSEQLAQAAIPDMQSMDYAMNQSMGSIGANFSAESMNQPIIIGNDQPIYVTLPDGRIIAETTAPFMPKLLQKHQDRRNSQLGRRG
ncbi:phage tail protein [Enterococcus sp. AZ163]|uniref:phage tail protein n=1 Tax=Enterococcus sp. AZ163 TaxID=2774638 RepID=UPI003D28194B